jgi:hypothetical protein
MDAARALLHHTANTKPLWYLGFDCATKTFGYSLSRIDVPAFLEAKAALRKKLQALATLLERAKTLLPQDIIAARDIIQKASGPVAEADRQTRALLQLVAGGTVDLFPGTADEGVSTVERLRAVVRHVEGVVKPQIAEHVPASEGLMVIIEFQMGANAKARSIAAALVAIFAHYNVALVGPSLKNKIHTCQEGKYCYFAERYRRNYDANKAHAKFNFSKVEEVFGTAIPPTRPPALRGHIADSFMQILGFLAHGDQENAAAHF